MGQVAVVGPVRNPAPLPHYPTVADVEDLDGDLERVDRHRDYIGVGAVRENDRRAFQRLSQRHQLVTQHRRPLIFEIAGRDPHLALQSSHHRRRTPA